MNINVSPNASPASDLVMLIDAAYQHLETLGYCADTRLMYQRNWDRLRQYAQEVAGTDQYSETLAESFLASVGLSSAAPAKGLSYRPRYCVRAIRVLSEFRLHGCFHRWCPSELYPPLTPAFERISIAYGDACRKAGIRERTIYTRSLMIRRLAEFLKPRGITEITELDAANISDFVAAQSHYNANTVCLLVRNLRLFLRYLQCRADTVICCRRLGRRKMWIACWRAWIAIHR